MNYRAPAAEPEVVDAGTFTLYQGGARIGEELFVIRREPGGSAGPVYRAGARLNLKLDGQTTRISVALEALGSECRLRAYEAEINGNEATSIVGTTVRDRIRLNVRSPRGDEMTEFLHRDKTVVLDPQIAHQYFFAWKLLAGNRSTEATVLVPREKNQHPIRIEDRGLEPVRLADAELELRHIAIIAADGSTRHVWLDGERVMRVEVPADEFRAERSDTAS